MPMKRIFRNKGVPITSRGQWRSIEFECVFVSTLQLNAFVAWAEEEGYDNRITIKHDGSIQEKSFGEEGREVVVSFKKDADKIVRDVCHFLKDKAYVNKSCGTHVHFDMRGIKPEMVEVYGKRLSRAVPALKQIVAKSRRNNHYCFGSINTINDYNRYSFINMTAYAKHKTIEVRGHQGTLNPIKILNWITLLDKIMHADISQGVSTPEEMIKVYKLGGTLAEFVNKRYMKVNNIKAPKMEEVYDPPVAGAAAAPAPIAPALVAG